MQTFTLPGATQAKGPPTPTKPPGKSPNPAVSPGGIPGLVGAAPTSPIPGGVQPTNQVPQVDVSNIVPGRPVNSGPFDPPAPWQPPPEQGSPSPTGQTPTGRNQAGPITPGLPAPPWESSVTTPTPTPFTSTLQPTTSMGGAALSGASNSAGGIQAPSLPTSPTPFSSTASAPSPTASYSPVQGQTAATVNAPGLAPSQATSFSPREISYQGGSPVSVGDFQRYEDAAFQDAMRRLNPVWSDRDAAFKQEMANRGIAVGSDAYQKALESQNRQRSDAEVTALYDAMRYGLQAQGQAFGQGLANAQLGQQDRAYGLQADMANNQFGLSAAQLAEGARQFDGNYGLNAANMQFGQNLANAQMANAMGQFNAQMGRATQNDLFGQQMTGAQFDNAIGQQNWQNALGAAGFNRDSLNQGFQNQLAGNNQSFMQGLANRQFGLDEQQQAFAQSLASGQFGLAANNQNFNQQMQSAGLANAMDQFAAMYGMDQARFGEGQRQFDANYDLSRQGLQNDFWRNSLAESNMGRQATVDAQRMQLQERQLMANFMLSLLGMGQNQDAWLWGGL